MTNCFSLALLFFESKLDGSLSGRHLCVSSETSHKNNLSHIYTASKVKHHLNIFLEKTVKLSKHDFFLHF